MNEQGEIVENVSIAPQLPFVPEAAHQASIPQANITQIQNSQKSHTNSKGETIEAE